MQKLCVCDCREVGVLCLVKFSGALVWGAADVLQVKYSEMPSMQTLGDSSQTLGFVFAAVGVGCFFGPILFNIFTPPRLFLYLLGLDFLLSLWIEGCAQTKTLSFYWRKDKDSCLSLFGKNRYFMVFWAIPWLYWPVLVTWQHVGPSHPVEPSYPSPHFGYQVIKQGLTASLACSAPENLTKHSK